MPDAVPDSSARRFSEPDSARIGAPERSLTISMSRYETPALGAQRLDGGLLRRESSCKAGGRHTAVAVSAHVDLGRGVDPAEVAITERIERLANVVDEHQIGADRDLGQRKRHHACTRCSIGLDAVRRSAFHHPARPCLARRPLPHKHTLPRGG